MANEKLVITLSGRKGSGKDTIARMLREGVLSHLTHEVRPFAGPLKEFCVSVLGLRPEHVYGADEDKNNPTHIRWEDIAGHGERVKCGPMSAREVLQWVGTEWVRRADPTAWVRAWENQVRSSPAGLILCTDCRFPNEVQAAHGVGGLVIRLLRAPHAGDEHASERALDEYPLCGYDLVVDNTRQTPEQTLREVAAFLRLARPELFVQSVTAGAV